MFQFFWIMVQTFRDNHRRAVQDAWDDNWWRDPLAHPALRGMSERELADLPLRRSSFEDHEEEEPMAAPSVQPPAFVSRLTQQPSVRPESHPTGVSTAGRKARPVPPARRASPLRQRGPGPAR